MLRRVLRLTPYVALYAAALVSGCGTKDKSADSAKIADSIAAAMAAPAAPAVPAPPAMTDANILFVLDFDNVADSSAGAVAVSKGTDAAVKDYGKMMVKDHHALRVEGLALAKKDSITPVMPAGHNHDAEKAVADSLTAMPKGADWDKFYINHMVAGHENVLRTAQEASNNAQNADVKALVQKATPVVQKHLDKAKEIQTKLNTPKP